jgi:polar amino acid transport system substrate-binding protein
VEEPLPGGSETILVADDDASLRELSEKVLSHFGYTVITAEDGQDAVNRFREKVDKISLIILDVIMPRMNGRETCDEIRRIRPDIKVIFTSGYTADIIYDRGMFEENMEYVTKPLSPATLLKKVREVLDRDRPS